MRARLLRIAGRVHGVGYREWLGDQAQQHGISGWVRNRADGTVEALLDGEEDALNAVLTACRRGPPLAWVESIVEEFAETPEAPGFRKRPTL